MLQKTKAMSDRPTKKFLVEYYHDGCDWGETIHAYDHGDAEARVKKLGNMRLLGELKMTIPAGPRGNFIPNVICWFKNLFS